MSVYTKTGDKGYTSLYTGERVPKNSLRVKAYGTIDEANAALAMVRATCTNERVREIVLQLQKNNGMLMGDLASVGQPAMINEASVEAGGPDNIAVTVEEPTMDSSAIITSSGLQE